MTIKDKIKVPTTETDDVTVDVQSAMSSEQKQKQRQSEERELARTKAYLNIGGATSFVDAEGAAESMKLSDEVFDLCWAFDSIAWNISRDVGDTKNKSKRVVAEARELVKRIEKHITDAEDSDTTTDTTTDDDATTDDTTDMVPAEAEIDDGFKSKVLGVLQKLGIVKSPQIKTLGQNQNMMLFKNGDQHFLYGRPTNNILDLEDDILTEESHKEFIEWLDENPDEAPELWSWHEEGTARKSRASWWDYADGFVHMIWPLTEDEAQGIKNFTEEFNPGMSHGFLPLGVAPGIKVLQKNGALILKYRMQEASILPVDFAANPYTTFTVLD